VSDGNFQLVSVGHGRVRAAEPVPDRDGDVPPFGISQALAEAYIASQVGMSLNKAFPVGTLDRGQMVVLAAWQAKFAPEIRKRKRKHRRK
jgi:hypothetical protein